ncbi:MAG TPA: GNAT family N-acetyltransferase [Lachnospiraceae bacterium]|nr:GNAT family N-acetyltransferase [Lachnospiraceae bacterium]
MEHNQQIVQQIEDFCMNHPGAYESRPFGEYPICYRVMGKIFVQLNSEPHFYKMTLKCNPEQAYFYRDLYPNVIVRGYHCPPVQQPYWNTIDLDLFSDMELLCTMIDEAYEETVRKLKKKARQQLVKLSELEFRYMDASDDFAQLCFKLDQTLNEIVGGEDQRSAYVQYNLPDDIHDVIVVYHQEKPIACGSFKMYDDEHAELKRIYVEPTYSGMGLGEEIIRRLEARAKIKGFRWCILETGEPLAAACHIYRKLGYQVIPNYGPYAALPESICMQRKI